MKVEYIDHMGNDNFIANVARVSFGADGDYNELPEDYTKDKRDKLLGYLGSNGHWTPFAHPVICLRLTAPIPIRTQCFKHKVGFVENEESRRYIDTTPTFFKPSKWRARPDGSMKQGSSGENPHSILISAVYENFCNEAIILYEELISLGVAPEQARFVLPQGCEVSWVWTGSLSSFARFYKQRTDPHAQQEIQDLAHMVGAIIEPLFPKAWPTLL